LLSSKHAASTDGRVIAHKNTTPAVFTGFIGDLMPANEVSLENIKTIMCVCVCSSRCSKKRKHKI